VINGENGKIGPAGTLSNGPVINLVSVGKVYQMGTSKVHALAEVCLQIHCGEFVSITGPSGSGKTTMMGIMGCLDRPTSGGYYLDGQLVSQLSDRQLAKTRNEQIGFVFQTFNLIPRASAADNVAIPLFYARKIRTHEAAREALEQVGLADRAGHRPGQLSGGERQRVALARAIVNRPKLVLADEPTGNLDTRTGAQIVNIFHKLHRQGTTIVLVTHERDIAIQAERMVQMRDGRIIDDTPVDRKLREDAMNQADELAGKSTAGQPPDG